MKLLAWLLGAAAVCEEWCAGEFGENVCNKDHAETCGTCEGCTSEGDADGGGNRAVDGGGGGDAASGGDVARDETDIWLLIGLVAGAASVAFVISGAAFVMRRRRRVYSVAQVPSNPKRFQHGSWVAAQLAALPQREATRLFLPLLMSFSL